MSKHSWEQFLEELLKISPIPHYRLPISVQHLWVLWNQDDEILQQQHGFRINNTNKNDDSFSADIYTRRMISDKIKHAFLCANFDEYSEVSIIQFWAPVMTISGRRLLSTSGQPFAVNHPSSDLCKYRLRCIEYHYCINNQNDDDDEDDDDPMIISDAPTVTAFLNRVPELVLLKNLNGLSPLVDSALECDLSYSYMLPICFPSQSTSCCIGVLEFSVRSVLSNDEIVAMIRALEEVGLGVFQIQERIPYQIIAGLKHARDEIEEALKIICESNNTPLAQVWVAFENANHVPFSSYLEGTQKKHMLSLKLTGYLADTDFGPRYDEYYGLCDVFPLEIGEDFVEKTLKDYKPRLCNDVSKLSGDTLVKELFVGVRRLAICLNSIHTGNFCYAFEFIWGEDPDSGVKFVEELLLKLKELLPRFMPASGDDFGFIKVGNSTAETKLFKIFQEKRGFKMFWILQQLYLQITPQRSENDSTSADLTTIQDKIRSEKDSSSSGDLTRIHAKIRSAFSKISTDIGVMLQFWAPITINGIRLLSTDGQPFTLSKLDEGLHKYRLHSVEYVYNIDVNYKQLDINEQLNPMIINGAPAARAFLNHFPLLVDIDQGNPLTCCALECELTTSLMLPVCWPSQNSSCIGVVECSIASRWSSIFKLVNMALQEVGLSIFQAQERIPYQMIDGLKPARDEIEEALKMVCESNNTPLAQVWIAFEAANHVPVSSYLEGTPKKQKLSLKLTGYLADTDSGPCYDEYYGVCDVFPLEMGDDFVAKILDDYKPRLCNDVSKLSGDTLVKQLFYDVEVNRLAICLNSIHTRDVCYAFEFIWGDDPDSNVKFVEELLLTLKKLLPSFKLASGAELGDELDIIKVDDSAATETKVLKIFQGKFLSSIPKVLEEGRRIPVRKVVDYIAPLEAKYKTTLIPLSREVIEQQFGNTETEAAENLKVSRSTLRRKCRKLGILKWEGRKKRKVNDLYSIQRNKNEENTGTIQEPLPVDKNEHSLTIKAEYAGDMIKFHLLGFQATFETVMEVIGTRLKLTPETYKVKYLDEDKDWILLTSEQDMIDCIKTFRSSDQTAVRLCVELST